MSSNNGNDLVKEVKVMLIRLRAFYKKTIEVETLARTLGHEDFDIESFVKENPELSAIYDEIDVLTNTLADIEHS
jgi:hypothetical protein